ncbi:MAG TPA: MBL fold metallo-hydrolase [Fimbriimonadaceae bacterium]|nr:MBL fold metallo-hydrolase [Fimbriimonadaceae bacterium]
MPRSITFDGAARTVTGSRHWIESNGKRILVDCGLFQGPREIRERNWTEFPFDPGSIDVMLLTHAHTDHVGMLPKLVREGFRGPVYATGGTIAIAKVCLPDGGRIQEEDARFHNRHGTSRHEPAEPLFTEADAYEALKVIKPVHYHEPLKLPGGATARYLPAGHILGACHIEITFDDGFVLLMSGDVGRYNRPILKDPTDIYNADVIVMESTYGDRVHDDDKSVEVLERLIKEADQNRSVILVPSFAIGRTQELLWNIHLLIEQKRIPHIPIYVDSPMATAATLLYATHTEDHDKEMRIHMGRGESPLRPDLVRFVRDSNMSKQLNHAPGPMMIIAGSGMLTGGRIQHHLRAHIGDPSTVVLFTGYQAEGTLGRKMIEGADHIRLFHEELEVKARVEKLNSLSAHADSEELLKWISKLNKPPKQVHLVHGDYEVQQVFRQKIIDRYGYDVDIPPPLERHDL